MNPVEKQLARHELLKRLAGNLVDTLRLRQFVNALLEQVPIRIKQQGVFLWLRCWADIIACAEIFKAGVYDSPFLRGSIRSYCDLGCQSGLALFRLASLSHPPVQALLVDANPKAVQRCLKNIEAAGYQGIHVVHGIVDGSSATPENQSRFVVRLNELESSIDHGSGSASTDQVIQVEVLDIEKTWSRLFAESACDLLKIDIEGSELALISRNDKFLARVKGCVIEWHNPPTSETQIIDLLKARGFNVFEKIMERPGAGVFACYRSP